MLAFEGIRFAFRGFCEMEAATLRLVSRVLGLGLGGQGAQLADAEAGVEEGPDDELLSGRLTGVGEVVGLLGGEGLADVLVGHCFPRTVRLESRKAQGLRLS